MSASYVIYVLYLVNAVVCLLEYCIVVSVSGVSVYVCTRKSLYMSYCKCVCFICACASIFVYVC